MKNLGYKTKLCVCLVILGACLLAGCGKKNEGIEKESEITSLEELDGKKIGITEGSSYDELSVGASWLTASHRGPYPSW
ncbi:MAG: hypothetical protein ACI4HI_07805, partial [Lachnospiraceae bacterium]